MPRCKAESIHPGLGKDFTRHRPCFFFLAATCLQRYTVIDHNHDDDDDDDDDSGVLHIAEFETDAADLPIRSRSQSVPHFQNKIWPQFFLLDER